MRSRVMNTSVHQHQRNNATSNRAFSIAAGNSHSSVTPPSNYARNLHLQRNILLVLCTILSIIIILSHWKSFSVAMYSLSHPSGAAKDDSSCEISLGEYLGPVYHSVESGTIGEPKCLLNSKWMQVSLHTVKFPGSDATYDDWMWIDYYDRINVLVEDERKVGGDSSEEPRFLVFQQTKYALEGRKSMAVVGGIIEVGEDPESAARREVEEEMDGLACENFHFLGRHRSDVNRGIGWLNGFLATNCTHGSGTKNVHSLANEIGAADTEKQKLKSISLSELRQALAQGKFIEVQWTATVAQALLRFYS